MNKIKLFLIVLMSICWVSITASNSGGHNPDSQHGFASVEDKSAEGKSVEDKTALDSTQISDEETDIPTKTENEIEEDTEAEFENDDQTSKSSDNGLNLLILVISIAALGMALFVYLTNRKKIDELNTKIVVLDAAEQGISKDIEALKSSVSNINNIQNSIHRLQEDYNDLRNTTSKLRDQISKINQRPQASQSTGGYSGPNLNKTSQDDKGKLDSSPAMCNVRYVSNLTINNDGSLSMPIRTLYPNNQGELFMVSWDINTGKGEYTINPKAADIMAQSSKLQQFTEGLSSMKGSHISVVRPGLLVLEGTTLIVKEKLQIKCD